MTREYWEDNVVIASMEIASYILSGSCGDGVVERVLEHLDISDEEASVLEANVNQILEYEVLD